MPDDFGIERAERRDKSGRGALLAALLAFVLGAAIVSYFAWTGDLQRFLPSRSNPPATLDASVVQSERLLDEDPQAPASDAPERRTEAELSTVEARLAMLEDRFSRINLQANAASGNAARAEGLLIAFAARRTIDRGTPLHYLEDQLRLRFTNAQPLAVETVISFANQPVTIDELTARLDAIGDQIATGEGEESGWSRVRRELGEIFTIRRDSAPIVTPQDRIDRAKLLTRAGRIDAAISQVRRLPENEVTSRWIADARRYAAAQRALDLIETTAMLEPRRLQDAEGNRVEQPSPLAEPAESEDAPEADDASEIATASAQ
ncbi:hypothetical protein GCM10011371_30250 [Novosphingobium marinum]|uniref:Inner membrane protein n=1 Tax=Novosphingobium marinum TaxID=1514948 RepID=A0A7Y9XV02_9SPHN|nr:hypothetical protein [Novosphingobium marinum]NYH95022.1 hypothetical protein [Novosphingobium marinum]GGC40798.1 hypothetical protein GCM10011371_30250 [Novosphingobium marinum]